MLKPTGAVPTRKSQWGDNGRDLLSGGSVFHIHSSTDAALASAGAPLFDTIINSRCQGNVGLMQMTSFSHGFPADNSARSSGTGGNGGSGPSGSQPDGRNNDDLGGGACGFFPRDSFHPAAALVRWAPTSGYEQQ